MQLRRLTGLLTISLLLAACGAAQPDGSADTISNSSDTSSIPEALQRVAKFPTAVRCPDSHKPGMAHCTALVRTTTEGRIAAAAVPSGFGPADLADAYKLPPTGGSGITVAIVDAQDDPSAEQDLATYRSTYGLPPCTTANGCFKKVNQNGVQGSYPSADQGWAGEIALDIEMVSAACPSCKILLVEATSASMTNLGTAVNTAVNLGAQVVSNSYGGSEDSSVSSTDSTYFHHPGVAIFASAGDSGYGAEYPATSQYVTAVGGTALARSTSASRGWVESVWGTSNNANGGTGSGCSQYVTKPSWQTDSGCGKRMVADVSAVADPNTGVAVYDSYGSGGWAVYGGTSVASPLVAAIYALTAHTSDSLGYPYSHTSNFFDVTSGTNGSCSSSTPYFCKAQTGYDGPTGFGTPNGAALVGGGGTPANDFSITLNSTNVSMAQGSSKTITVTTSVTSGSAQSVALSVTGLPSGVTGSFSPSSVTAGSSSTLTLTASSTATVTTATFTVTGSASSGSHSATGSLTVTSSGTGGGSALTNGVPVSNLSGATGSQQGFTLAVPAGASGLSFKISGGSGDADLYVKFGSAPTTSSYDCRPYISGNSETCTISNVQVGTYYVMINGYAAYSGVSLVGSYSTQTQSNDFSVSLASSSASVTQGSSTTVTVKTAVTSGSAQSVSLSVSGLPAGVTGTFSPASVSAGGSSTLTLTASATATTGTATFTVKGTATSGSHSTSGSLTVNASSGGGGGSGALSNGVPVSNLSGATGSQQVFTLVVPSGASGLSFKISGGSGDADMYVKFGSAPTLSSYDCRPYVSGNSETCSITNVQAGTYYVMLNGYAAYSGVTLVGSYTTGSTGGGTVLVNGTPVVISGASGSTKSYTFPVSSPSGSVTVKLSGGSGDADLYVKFGSAPTTTSYDCRPYVNGNNETCNLTGQSGTYYVMVRGYSSYSNVSLVGSY